MIIEAQDYSDFKALITQRMTTADVVYTTTMGDNWFAWALKGQDAVTIRTYDGIPVDFATDFPSAVSTNQPIAIS